ncbi:MAG: phosphoribosyltransferase [Candidatus Hodarchaeaceae archaeon]|nr:phosphoribosyltransferase [Candidatus Hodarchaeaceae archaeon]
MEQLTLSWDEVERAAKTLANSIKRDFDPDILVGVARGGLIPAVRLSHLLGDKLLRIIHVRYYKGANARLKKPELLADIERIEGKVLVVDDVADTGTSLDFVLKHLKGKGAKEVRTATIAYKPKSRLKPDYFVYETDKWVVFPWEEAPPESG